MEEKFNNTNYIYVVDMNETPLMPTLRLGMVRHLLKNGHAIIYKREPFFTIKLTKHSSTYTQPFKAGMDIGETIGISVVTYDKLFNKYKEVLSSEIKTRSNKIPSNLEDKAMYRRGRRNGLRYRKPRWQNRGASLGKCKVCGGNTKTNQILCGKCLSDAENIHQKYRDVHKTFDMKRYAPSIKHIILTHFKIIDEINKILPLKFSDWIIEKTKFDIQKLENAEISGNEYQEGNLFNFINVREYVLDRDDHKCQNPNCKHKNKKIEKGGNIYIKNNIPLVIHHIVYRSNGGTDKVSNLITLCTDCHTPTNHKKGYFLWDWNIKQKKVNSDYKGATKMNVLSSAFNDLNKTSFTYGAETKRKRQLIGLPKSHANDAFAIIFNQTHFKLVDDTVVFKDDIIIEKINKPIRIIQTNGRENGRRSLNSFYDAKYIDSRDGEEKSGNELARVKSKKTLIENNRVYRKFKTKKGKHVKRTGISQFPNNSYIKFNDNGNTYIRECGGMSGTKVYVKNYDKKTIAIKKYNVELLYKRKGLIPVDEKTFSNKK